MLLVAQYASSKDVVLSPAGLAKHFKYKKFPKGLGVVGQMVVEVKGKNKFGKDFGELVKPTGVEWEVDWTDGTKNQLIPQPTKNLTLSVQVDQDIMVNGKLMTCSLYSKKGCHLKDCSLITSPERTQSAQPRTTRSSHRQKQLKKTAATATPPSTPVKDGEKPTDTRKRKPTAQRAGAKKKWRKCRAPNLTNTQRGIATKAFADGKLDISFIFAERTLKEYVDLQKSPLHVNARNLFAAAIGQVMCQVNPETDKPLGGNVTAVFDILFPICQKVSHS